MNHPIPKLPYNIYWINLDRRPDRRKHMEEILINNKDNNFRISAIDYKNNFKPYNVIKHHRLNGGEHGCTCSHIKALHYFLSNCDDKYCFIAEEDLSDTYSKYWLEKHHNILKNSEYDILQLQTTSDIYNNPMLIPEKKYGSGTTFYKIKREVAEKIVKKHFDIKNMTINLNNHKHPVTDNFIWSYGNVYLLPMFSYLDVKDSETNPENKNMNDYWEKFFDNAKTKYLNFWKNV
tara:strand:+ start:1117 stop:1818 length:702 start_codon:yes stop_codon:yes gene_type:complete